MDNCNRGFAAILVVCLTGLFLGTEAGIGASGTTSNGPPIVSPVPAARKSGGPPSALPDREAGPDGKANLPKGASQDWWDRVQRQIAEDEYALMWRDATSARGPHLATAAPAGWTAPNRAQGFETSFTDTGMVVSPSKEGVSWTWGLSLVAWGRAGALLPAGKASLHVEKNRMEASRTGIGEWFLNEERGLEQGFTLPTPPAQPDSPTHPSSLILHPVCIDLALLGNLRPKFSEDGQAVDFYDSGNVSAVRYASLKVIDAAGRVLPSRLEGWIGTSFPNTELAIPNSASGLRITIDDSRAIYPITVDPLATSPAWTATGEAANRNFGASVATAGDVNGDGYSDVVVGAYGQMAEPGKVYLYLGSPSGLSATASWTAVGETDSIRFGSSVATAGDVNGDGYSDVVVGANGYNGAQGKVYLYLGGPSGLSATASWTAVGENTIDLMGQDVSTAGDVNGDGYSDLIVGASGYSTSTGKAYLYLGGPSGLSATASWTHLGEAASNLFGASVATAGDVNGDGFSDVVIGAYGYGTNTGKAYLYLGGPAGLSTTASWSMVGEATGNYYGQSVATVGDVNGDGYSDVVVGAYGNSSFTGKAYLYLGGTSGLSTTASWTAVGEATNNYFGNSVATAGDVNGDGYSDAIVGAFGYTSNTGKAFLYMGGPSGLSAIASWTATGEAGADYYGTVATAGDVNGDGYSDVVVGSWNYWNGIQHVGKAYLYLGSASGLADTSAWTGSGDETQAYFGISVATAGDVNGDGYTDVIVGASGHDAGAGSGANRGRAYLYLGSSSGLATTPAWTASGDENGAGFGWSVAAAGDVNGDGYADALVGAPMHDAGGGAFADRGRAYLYLGSPSGLSATPAWTASGDEDLASFGYSVATAGDVNGDGYADVIIGAYGHDAGAGAGANRGRAYVYLGSTSGLATSPAWTASGDENGTCFGWAVSTAGDVNGDGYSDVVIGANNSNVGGAGKAYLFLGGASGLSTTSSWSAVGGTPGDFFGGSVATAGDVNGDGYSDVIVGASGYNSDYGRVYYYMGTPAGLSPSASWIAGTSPGALFGTSVASAGDVNGDGYSDVIVGGPGYSTNRGRARLYLGSPAGLILSVSAMGETTNSCFGTSVAAAGDVNGDGYSDVVVGAYGFGTNTGRAYCYLGNGEAGGGAPVRPMQLRSDGTTPISPLGLAYEGTFRIGLKLRTPVGRDLVRLEWQTAPLGGSFDGVSNPIQHEATWWNSGLAGYYRRASVSLPEEPGPYVWRARIAYFTPRSPFQGHGPWFTLLANGSLETDLRNASTTAPPACVLPDEPCWLYSVVKVSTDITLNWQDPNQPDQRTGWNIRRSNNASLLPKTAWPLKGTNVADMDAGTANYQWTDHSGDDPGSGGVWYYEVTTYNANCPAEGPF
jgi:hypothetical protein